MENFDEKHEKTLSQNKRLNDLIMFFMYLINKMHVLDPLKDKQLIFDIKQLIYRLDHGEMKLSDDPKYSNWADDKEETPKIESDAKDYEDGREKLMNELKSMADDAINSGDKKLAYNIERTISELSEEE